MSGGIVQQVGSADPLGFPVYLMLDPKNRYVY